MIWNIYGSPKPRFTVEEYDQPQVRNIYRLMFKGRYYYTNSLDNVSKLSKKGWVQTEKFIPKPIYYGGK